MRNLLYTLTAIILFISAANAQLLDPRKVLKRKSTDRANQKVDQTIDKALDKVFDGFGKKKSSNDTDSDGNSADENTETPDPTEAMGKLFGKMGLGNTPPPAASYSFSSSYVMQLKSTGKKKDENYTMRLKYMFDDEGKIMGSKMISTDNADMNKSLDMMEGTVFDLENMYMYNFMNINGQKQYMGISVKEGAVGDALEGQYEKTTLKKLGQTRTIVGYKSEAYLTDDGKQQSTVWLSIDAVPSVARYYTAFNKMSASQKNQVKVAYQANAELVKLFQQGRALMAMEMEDKGSRTELEVVEISPRDSYTINTTGYSSAMDMNALMNGGQSGKN